MFAVTTTALAAPLASAPGVPRAARPGSHASALDSDLGAALGLWHANELATSVGAVLPTGYASLDAQLPGGGWPLGAMVELLQDQVLRHEWALLLPALVARLREQAGPLVLVGAGQGQTGAELGVQAFVPALAAQGLPSERLLWVHAGEGAAQLWAAEQALRCAQVAGVVLWLGAQVRQASTSLRRLHLAAQARGQLLFVLRPARARHEASPAPLRVLLSGANALQLQILKRRGPLLQHNLQWPAGTTRTQALLAAMRARGQGAPEAAPQTAAQDAASIVLPVALSRLIEAGMRKAQRVRATAKS
jgi:protein ImuA